MSVDTTGEEWVDAYVINTEGSEPICLLDSSVGKNACGGPYVVKANCGRFAVIDIDPKTMAGIGVRWCHYRRTDPLKEHGRLNLKTGEFVANEVMQETPLPEKSNIIVEHSDGDGVTITHARKRLPQVGERWKSRDGGIVTGPLEATGEEKFTLGAWCGAQEYLTWYSDGSWKVDGEHGNDLVELVEEAQPGPPPPTESIEARQFGDNIHEAIEDAAERQVVLDNKLMQQAIMGKRGDDQRRIAEAVCVLGAKLLRKNNDYGSSAWKRPKLASHLDSSTAIRVRMSDKLERIESLASKPAEVAGESLEDTLDDLVAYWILLKAAPVEEAGQ